MVKNKEVISDDAEVAKTLNNYFSNIVKNLKIQKQKKTKKLPDSIPQILSKHPTLNGTLKYKNHPSIHVIKRFSQRFSSFYFSNVDKNIVLKDN